jgi:hypothetical protein
MPYSSLRVLISGAQMSIDMGARIPLKGKKKQKSALVDLILNDGGVIIYI